MKKQTKTTTKNTDNTIHESAAVHLKREEDRKELESTYKFIDLSQHSLMKYKLSIIRDKTTKSRDFVHALNDIGTMLALEATKDIAMKTESIHTPLAETTGYKFKKDIVLIPILRSGIALINGFRDFIPQAKVGFLGLARNEKTLKPDTYYEKFPKGLNNAEVILIDPMLGTGGSSIDCISKLKKAGAKNIKAVFVLSSTIGVKKLFKAHPDVHVIVACNDPILTNVGYISPGLGDAGDRYFGTDH